MQSKIKSLQSLRAFAIFSVALFHFTYRWESTIIGKVSFTNPIFLMGHFGVQVFFMISGFIIYKTLRETSDFKTFFLHRVIRLIIPAIFLEILILIVAKYSGISDFQYGAKVKNLFPSISLIDPGWWNLVFHSKLTWISGVQWTLSIEVSFYLLAGCLYFFVNKRFFSELLVICSGVATLLDHIPHQSRPGIIHDIDTVWALTGFPLFWWFVVGVLFYRVFANENSIKNVALMIVSIGWVLLFTYDGYKGNKDGYPVIYALLYIAFSMLLLGLVSIKSSKFEKFAGNRFTVWIGDNSYEFYLIHEIVGVTVLRKLERHFHFNAIIYGLVAAIFCVALIYTVSLVRKFAFSPIQRYLRLKISR